MSFITVAVHCHNYQRRLCWMLSSLCQQVDPEVLTVDVAYFARNGVPSTEAVIEFYGRTIKIRGSSYTDMDTFQKRGNTRSAQLAQCSTEWLLFADCDMTYHPEYFARLRDELQANHLNATYMLSSGRMSTMKEATNKLIEESTSSTVSLIPDAFRRVAALPAQRKSNIGAGFSQIVNVRHAPHGGFYVDSSANPDWAWNGRFHKTRSDVHFRRRLGRLGGPRQCLPSWFTDGLIHLNHDRDKEVGYHLETQR